ncbi:MAG TPA: serine/threonine-protein kinase [Candidatus Dormibacteraeota bacterium]|jgi:serine/threonine protein kinase|nr:serine/threonine-protein kinase [Candidatus Dormibacteraeota bacterium]
MFEITGTIRYQQGGLIGVGEGMNSTVYRAFDPYLNRDIAVKVVSKSKFGNDFDSYCNEARAIFSANHPSIVKVEYVCETTDEFHLALPLYSNGSLLSKIRQHPLGLCDSLKIAQGVLAGLARIHVSRYLHLDIKPANILFDDDNQPLISDFGQSRKMSPTGTVNYPPMYKWAMPPEVLTSHVATVESDIFQMGTLLYRTVNGDPFYKLQKNAIKDDNELQAKILGGRFPDSRLFLPHVPRRMRTLIRKALQADPKDRFHSATEFAASLGRMRVALDWKTTCLTAGAYRWRVDRPGKSDLEVELIKNSSDWDVEVWTLEGQKRRRRNVSNYWRSGLKYRDAMRQLNVVFADLDS